MIKYGAKLMADVFLLYKNYPNFPIHFQANNIVIICLIYYTHNNNNNNNNNTYNVRYVLQ